MIALGIAAYVYWPKDVVTVSASLTVVRLPKPVPAQKKREKAKSAQVRTAPSPVRSGSSCGGLTWNSGVGCTYVSRGWQVGPLTEFEGPLK